MCSIDDRQIESNSIIPVFLYDQTNTVDVYCLNVTYNTGQNASGASVSMTVYDAYKHLTVKGCFVDNCCC